MPNAEILDLFEKIVERLLGARGARRRGGRLGLALHRRPWLEEGALVARVVGRDAGCDRLLALEGRAGVEVGALGTAVKIGLTARALARGGPGSGDGELGAAARALHHVTKTGHAEGLRRERRLPARRVFLLLLGLAFAAGLAGLVLVSALAVLAFGHADGSRRIIPWNALTP